MKSVKILLYETLKLDKKLHAKGAVVEVSEALAKELAGEKKAQLLDGSMTVPLPAPAPAPLKITLELVKKEHPEVYKEIANTVYDEAFKEGLAEAGDLNKKLKESVTVEFLKKEFPKVFDAITEGAFKAGAEEAVQELKDSITVELIEKEFPEIHKAIFQKGFEEGKKKKS